MGLVYGTRERKNPRGHFFDRARKWGRGGGKLLNEEIERTQKVSYEGVRRARMNSLDRSCNFWEKKKKGTRVWVFYKGQGGGGPTSLAVFI